MAVILQRENIEQRIGLCIALPTHHKVFTRRYDQLYFVISFLLIYIVYQKKADPHQSLYAAHLRRMVSRLRGALVSIPNFLYSDEAKSKDLRSSP